LTALEKEIGDLLRRSNLTLGTVESATGGLISHRITNVPGSSDYFKGAIVAYSNKAKINVVGVKAGIIETFGAVSARVAEEMARGGCRVLGADVCIADTGIAGPGGATGEKSVGLFYLGLAYRGKAHSKKHIFQGDREHNKHLAAEEALLWLREFLIDLT
jgi:PncC family amidohydrolase